MLSSYPHLQLPSTATILAYQHRGIIFSVWHIDGGIAIEKVRGLVLNLVDFYRHNGPVFDSVFLR